MNLIVDVEISFDSLNLIQDASQCCKMGLNIIGSIGVRFFLPIVQAQSISFLISPLLNFSKACEHFGLDLFSKAFFLDGLYADVLSYKFVDLKFPRSGFILFMNEHK